MPKLQCIVTSYQRPKYLLPCLESMRAGGDVELYVVDGGSDQETLAEIERLADGWLFLDGNPGGDVLRNLGVKRFVTEPRCVVTDDDFLFPSNWAARIVEQYDTLNRNRLEWAMVACSTVEIAASHQFADVSGVKILEVLRPQTSGTILDVGVLRRAGMFPEYGKGGAGGYVIGERIRKLGFRGGYLEEPALIHTGGNKESDYPEYSRAFSDEEKIWYPRCLRDDWSPKP